jgi:hypothetical protein
LLGGVMLALFYVPFALHPSFSSTYNYIADSRIGTTFPYNNLEDFFIRTTLYSTTYYVGLMVLATVAGLARVYWRNFPRWLAWVAILLLVAGVLMSVVRPTWLLIGGQENTWIFFTIAVAAAWFAPRLNLEERTVWLWFGLAMVFMLFFTLLPNTHVYGFIIPWALVVGMVIEAGYGALVRITTQATARVVGTAVASVLVLAFANYAAWYFAIGRSIFGFPLTNGWKAVGALYADGVLDAPFDVHGKEPVADWYTRGEGYCPRDPVYFLWHDAVEPGDRDLHNGARNDIEANGYQLYGEVTVKGAPRLAIYKMSDEAITPQRFAVEDYAARFDADLSGPLYEKDGHKLRSR